LSQAPALCSSSSHSIPNTTNILGLPLQSSQLLTSSSGTQSPFPPPLISPTASLTSNVIYSNLTNNSVPSQQQQQFQHYPNHTPHSNVQTPQQQQQQSNNKYLREIVTVRTPLAFSQQESCV
jgi:hypothetical protein